MNRPHAMPVGLRPIATLLSDTIRVVTLSGSQAQETTVFLTAGIPGIKGFSPNGEELVWGDGAGIQMGSVSEGAVRLILPPPAVSNHLTHVMAPPVIWEGGDPHMLVAYPSEATGGLISSVYDVNGTTGARVFLGDLPLAAAAPQELARSGDGQSFAAWVPIEAVRSSVERTIYRFQLVVQTTPGGPVRKVLERESSSSLRWLEFSSDRRRLGLALEHFTYVVRVDDA